MTWFLRFSAMLLVVNTATPSQASIFPVLFGDNYSVTVQFEGQAAETFSPSHAWGVGEEFDGGDYFTGTPFEAFWDYGTRPGYVVWRTFSSQLEAGFGTLNVPESHASIRAQVSHDTATYADFTVTGLDGWSEYPGLSPIADYGVDPNSIQLAIFASEFSNVVVDGTTISFRVSSDPSETSEFNVGFRGAPLADPVPKPSTLAIWSVLGGIGLVIGH
jgi:hypothetical protein